MNLRTVSSTSSWAALPDLPARGGQVGILNTTGEDLEIRHIGETDVGEQITIPDGSSVAIPVASNAKELQIKGAIGAAGVQLVITP
jgi:hypothetical protein